MALEPQRSAHLCARAHVCTHDEALGVACRAPGVCATRPGLFWITRSLRGLSLCLDDGVAENLREYIQDDQGHCITIRIFHTLALEVPLHICNKIDIECLSSKIET